MFTNTRKLPWPMSRIDRDLLHELWLEGQATGKPITAIVAEAVTTHLNQQFASATRVGEARLPYQGQPQAAA